MNKDVGRVGDAEQALAVPATPAGAVDGPSDFDPSRGAPALVSVLREVSKQAMFRGKTDLGSAYSVARSLGFIDEHVINKSCSACGSPKFDYRYSKLTLGGQAYLSLAIAMDTRSDETERLGPKGDSAAIAQQGPTP